MRSPTLALLWEIWSRHRSLIFAVIGLTIVGRLLEPSALLDLLAMIAFLLLFAIFNYTDSSGSRGVGRFPHRLFVLPVSSLQLVAIPMLTGIAAIELLYVAWSGPLSKGGSTGTLFIAVLLGATMVIYQASPITG